jgi:hypothetical protein
VFEFIEASLRAAQERCSNFQKGSAQWRRKRGDNYQQLSSHIEFKYLWTLPEHHHQTALESVSGSNLGRVLRHCSSVTLLKGGLGANFGQKSAQHITKLKLK